MDGEKLFMRSDLTLKKFHPQIGNFPNQPDVSALGQIGSILIPSDSRLDLVLLLVKCAQVSR